jgi:medium-chain acyl-[acyl-carrier-protein] hydrolase
MEDFSICDLPTPTGVLDQVITIAAPSDRRCQIRLPTGHGADRNAARQNMPQAKLRASSAIIRLRHRPAALVRLFCFPPAGRGAYSFRSWAETCHPAMEVILIQLPGRENRVDEAPFTSMGQIVSALGSEFCDLLDRPYALYGHSLGAKIAFEIARETRRRELPQPKRLYAAAAAGPAVKWCHPGLRQMTDADLLREIQLRYGAIPLEVLEHRDLCAPLTAALRADLAVIESYDYAAEPPISTPIACFCGTDDTMTPECEVLEWAEHTCAGFHLERFPGGHFFPDQARARILDWIAGDLQADLNRERGMARRAGGAFPDA